MRSKKENDTSQGFFSRLKESAKEVFGKKIQYEEKNYDDLEKINSLHEQITNSNQISNDFIPKVHINPPNAFYQNNLYSNRELDSNEFTSSKDIDELEIE
jgi:hypothetical protein